MTPHLKYYHIQPLYFRFIAELQLPIKDILNGVRHNLFTWL